jgi:hypothetical protein
MLTLTAVPAFAQTAAAPPAETTDRTAQEDAPITLRGSITQAYDDNTAADTAIGITGTRLGLFSGLYSAADGELTFRHKGRSSFFSGEAGTAVRYEPGVLDLTTATHQASVRLVQSLGESGRLTLSQSAGYAPLLTLASLGGGATASPGASAFDAAVSTVGQLHSRTDADFGIDLTRRTTLAVTSGYSWQQLAGGFESVRRYDVGGRMTRSVTPRLSVTGGYDYQMNTGGAISQVHDALLSVVYDRPVSQTKHLRVAASTGTSLLDDLGRRQLRAIASAHVSRDIARTWQVGASFARQYSYFDWLAEPVFANRFGADLSGRLTGHLLARFDASYAGNQEITSSASAFTVSLVSGSLTYSLTPKLGLYAAYTRFHYDFLNGGAAALAGPVVGRNSIRGGLVLQLPLAGHSERSAP